MIKINVNLTNDEYEALSELLFNSISCCRSGCIWDKCYEKMIRIKDEDKQYHYCDRCAFTKAVQSLEEKLLKENQ